MQSYAKKSINLFEAVNIAHDIANELKCLRKKAEGEFYQLYISAQKTAKTQNFILKTTRLTSRQTYRCKIAAETDEEYFRIGIFMVVGMVGSKDKSSSSFEGQPLQVRHK